MLPGRPRRNPGFRYQSVIRGTQLSRVRRDRAYAYPRKASTSMDSNGMPSSRSSCRVPIPRRAQNLGPTAVRAKYSREHTHRRRLAGSVGAEQPEHLPAGYLQVDPVERATTPKRLRSPSTTISLSLTPHHSDGASNIRVI